MTVDLSRCHRLGFVKVVDLLLMLLSHETAAFHSALAPLSIHVIFFIEDLE